MLYECDHYHITTCLFLLYSRAQTAAGHKVCPGAHWMAFASIFEEGRHGALFATAWK